MLPQKETAAELRDRSLLRTTVFVVLFLSLGLLVMGVGISRTDAVDGPSVRHNAIVSLTGPSNAAAEQADSATPMGADSGIGELSQRKLLAVMLTALAAALLWLWHELPMRRQSRQKH